MNVSPSSDNGVVDPPGPARPRRGRMWAALLGAVLLVGLLAGGLSRVSLDTGIDSFLPGDDPTSRALEAKARTFGGDPVIVILEADAGDPGFLEDQEQLFRVVALEGVLADLPDVAAVYGPGTVANQTAGAAQDILAQISGRRDGYRETVKEQVRAQGGTPAQVKAAGKAAETEFDERYGALVVQGLPAGLPTLRNSRFVRTLFFGDQGDRPRPQWRFIVPSATSISLLVRPREELDQEAASRLTDAVRTAVAESGLQPARTTVTGAPALTSALTDRARAELPVLGIVSVLAVGLVFLLVPWTSRRRGRYRPTLSALLGTGGTVALFGWFDHSLSLGVVAFLPILLGIGSDFPLYLSRGGRDRQVLVAAGASALAFASLLLSPLPFVQELGLALALGLVLTAGVALWLRALLGPLPPPPDEVRGSGVPVTSSLQPSHSRGRRIAVAVAVVVTSAVGWALLPSLEIQAQPEQLARGLDELADAEYAEQVLGSSGEVAIVMTGTGVDRPDVLSWSREVQTSIVRTMGDRVHPILSLSDLFRFLGEDPTQEQVDAGRQVVPSYLTQAVLASDGSEAVILLGVEFDDVAELGVLLDEMEAEAADPPDGITVELVGLPVAAVRGLDLVSDGRVLLNLAGIAAAGLVLLLGLARRRDALRAIVTVVIATGWVAGVAAATTGSLNPLTVAIGSLTTATGVEFAVMLGSGARQSALRAVATAAVAGTVGYLVLALSELAVLRDFGLLLSASVVCSFAAALLVCRVLLPESETQHDNGVDDSSSPDREEVPV